MLKHLKAQTDYLRKYYIFNTVLVFWLLFIPLKNTFYEASIILMILMFFYHIVTFKTHKTLHLIIQSCKDIFITLSIIMVSMLFSSILGLDVLGNLIDLLKFFYRYVMILFILLYFYHYHFFDKHFIVLCLLSILTLYALDGLYQYVTHYDLFFHKSLNGQGLTGPTFNRNIFGLLMFIYCSLLLFLLLRYEQKKHSYLFYIFFTLGLFMLSLSLSRASWTAFATFTILYILINAKNILISKKNLLLVLCMTVTIFILFHFNQTLLNRFQTLIQGSDSGRIIVWKYTLDLISNSLWFGYGVDSSLTLFTTAVKRVHNMPLEIALYFGIFGVISYSLFFGIIYKIIYFTKQYYYAFFLTAYLVLLQFDGSLANSKLHLSYLILLVFFISTHIVDQISNAKASL